MRKSKRPRFTEDSIHRDLAPDVFCLLHDLAYLRPHATGLRQRVMSFINGAQDALSKKSDGDIDEQLKKRELFSIDRCIDQLCELCADGIKAERVEYSVRSTEPRRIVHYFNQRGEAIVRDCPSLALHLYRERIVSGVTVSYTRAAIIPPEGC